MEITRKMSEESRKRAEKEAFENAEKVVDSINAETEKEGDPAYIDGTAEAPGTLPNGEA